MECVSRSFARVACNLQNMVGNCPIASKLFRNSMFTNMQCCKVLVFGPKRNRVSESIWQAFMITYFHMENKDNNDDDQSTLFLTILMCGSGFLICIQTSIQQGAHNFVSCSFIFPRHFFCRTMHNNK